MNIGDRVVLKAFNGDCFVIIWTYENGFVEIKSLVTGEVKPIHILDIEPLTNELKCLC